MGANVRLSRLMITKSGREAPELNIYGVTDDLCIIGDVTLDLNKVRELIGAINELRSRYPQYLRPRVIKVLYCMRYVPKTIEETRRNGIWVLTWREELTPFIAFTTEVSSLCHAWP